MDTDNIWSQIAKRIAGEDSDEDSYSVEGWLNEKPVNKEIFIRLNEIWNFREPSLDKHYSLFESIKRKIYVYENRPTRSYYNSTLFKIAAVLMLFLISNFLVYKFTENIQNRSINTYQEVIVPRGNRMKITLPDSSSIWLNNETKLRYASNFGKGIREVELSGEAYFDVKHDVSRPFIVKVGNQRIKVLGTRFSVNAYPEDHMIETSLISGSIVFSSDKSIDGNSEIKLVPGYSLLYDKQNNSISTAKIQPSFYNYWENGVYSFKDESFESLSVKIKRIFNVEVVFESSFLKTKTYTGSININDNIFILMEAITKTSKEPIEYKFNKNVIYVKLKKESKSLN